MPLPLKIFINYRREDRPELVKKIRDGFVVRYGEENVFMDLDIPNYTSFSDHLEEKVGVSNVLVACIGPEWLRLLKKRAKSSDPDYLVGEIEQALGQQHSMVATICIDGAEIPPKDALPREIQDMLEFQIPNYQFADEFLTEIVEVMNDIEREFERRGITSKNSMSIDRKLSQGPQHLEEYLVQQIDEANFTTIRKHLRDFPTFLVDTTADIDTDQIDNITSQGEGISVFGTTFVKYDQDDLLGKYLISLQDACKLAYRRFPIDSQRTSAIWHEVLKTLYLLGALTILEDKPRQVSSLLQSAITPLQLDKIPRHWLLHLQLNRARTLPNRNGLVSDILRSISGAGYPYHQFSNDQESLTDLICQCDFLHCLSLNVAEEARSSAAWPFFGEFYLDRIAPIFERIVTDNDSWRNVIGLQISDRELALNFARICSQSKQVVQQAHRYPRPLWDNSVPRIITDFLSSNLTENEMFCWRNEL